MLMILTFCQIYFTHSVTHHIQNYIYVAPIIMNESSFRYCISFTLLGIEEENYNLKPWYKQQPIIRINKKTKRTHSKQFRDNWNELKHHLQLIWPPKVLISFCVYLMKLTEGHWCVEMFLNVSWGKYWSLCGMLVDISWYKLSSELHND